MAELKKLTLSVTMKIITCLVLASSLPSESTLYREDNFTF